MLSDYFGNMQSGELVEEVSVPFRGLDAFGPVGASSRAIELYGVSVPFRGLDAFGPPRLHSRRRYQARVSVPFRGLDAFGLAWEADDPGIVTGFPSPFGD